MKYILEVFSEDELENIEEDCIHICETCKEPFFSIGEEAKYCPVCLKQREQLRINKFYQRKKDINREKKILKYSIIRDLRIKDGKKYREIRSMLHCGNGTIQKALRYEFI